MSESNCSRRQFLGACAGSAVAPNTRLDLTPPNSPVGPVWIIISIDWEHNDELTYPYGEFPLTSVYFDREAAEAACRQLCANFYGDWTPSEFGINVEDYFPEAFHDPEFDPDSITWEQVIQAGCPEPYFVLEQTPVTARTSR